MYRDHQFRYTKNADDTLFSGHHKTKILPADLPEWYIYGRYHKCWGYMSAKGITDMLYVPNKHVNHFLKDDVLFVSYGGKIEEVTPTDSTLLYSRYTGYDESVWGSEILYILQAARLYSNYDISDLILQIKDKKAWLIERHPDEFGSGKWDFDVDEFFSAPYSPRRSG